MLTLKNTYCANSIENIYNFNSSGNITLATLSVLCCRNATEITNGSVWADYMTVLHNHPVVNTDQIVRVPATCTPVAQKYQKNRIHFNISFPAQPSWQRQQAWWDTLLGGLGDGTWFLNSVDIELSSNKPKITGQDVSHMLSLHTQ